MNSKVKKLIVILLILGMIGLYVILPVMTAGM